MSQSSAVLFQPCISKEIQVSGLNCFPESRWREALLYYLFGVWANRQEVTYRPKVHFSTITLRLDPSISEYYAYLNRDRDIPLEEVPLFTDGETLMVGCQQVEVEQALIRFVKNNRIKMLVISLRGQQVFYLWKKQRRGEYGVSGRGLLTGDQIALADRPDLLRKLGY